MRVLEVRNVCEALPKGVELLLTKGHKSPSRAGEVIVAPWPVATIYSHPRERVLFSPVRDANPAFHLVEALWMLAGRNDAAFLNLFVKDFGDRFAEPNGTIHGAYGHRWRKAFGFDQLKEIVRRLIESPNDRQCVLQMWDAVPEHDGHCWDPDDLQGSWKDRPCLAGDTIIWSPEGDLPISELAKKFSDGAVRWPVYSVCSKTKALQLKWATACWKSGRKQTSIITFDDGSIIRATVDHVFYRYPKRVGREGNPGAISAVPVSVEDLRIGDRILATRRFYGKKGHEVVKKFLGKNTAFRNLQSVHNEYYKLVYGGISEGCELHHINEQKCDNRILNLEPLDPGDHSRHHKLGDKNPSRRMSLEQRLARGRKHSISLKKSWAKLTPEQHRARAKGLPLPDNHKIVNIAVGEVEDVYDFTVPGFHTAIVGTGIVTHNCNTHAYFRVRDGLLDIGVCCRSNDIIMGAYGANAVHFSILQEYMAAMIDVGVGTYTQFSFNYHMYVKDLEALWKKGIGEHGLLPQLEANYYGVIPGIFEEVAPLPLVSDPESFDHEVDALLYAVSQQGGLVKAKPFDASKLNNHFLQKTAWPLFAAYLQRSVSMAQEIEASDWRLALTEWLQRRAG